MVIYLTVGKFCVGTAKDEGQVKEICLINAKWEPLFHLGRLMYGSVDGMLHLERFLMEEKTGKSTHEVPGNDEAFIRNITQPLDHFDKTSSRTWEQLYFYNEKYRNSVSDIAFLMIGGESAAGLGWVSNPNTPFIVWAKKFGAVAFLLEHRYYGQSRPTRNQSVENLKYLSSRQAIEDIAHFIRTMNAKFGFKNPIWITFGGSYAGSLSLWARQAYPDLIAGAVGSSAPVRAVVDFWGYLDVVENAIRSHSDKCAENIREGFQIISKLMLSEDGRTKLSETLKLEPPLSQLNLTYNDIQMFHLEMYSKFQVAVQYNRINAGAFGTEYGIPEVCKIMEDKGDPLNNIQRVIEYMATLRGKYTKTFISYNEMIEYLKKEKFGSMAGFDSSVRSWTWQTCTEFGYFQTTDGGPKNIFGSGTPLTLFLNMCSDVFGKAFNSDAISNAIRSTQLHYGGHDRYTGTNVVILNGNIDPWHALSKYSSDDESVVWYLINGTSHCADMMHPSKDDLPSLTVARKIVERNIGIWIDKAKYKSEKMKDKQVDTTWRKPVERGPLTSEEIKAAPKAPIELSKMKFPEWTHNKKLFLGRPPHGFLPPPDEVVADPSAGFEVGFFLQPVDHFDNQNPYTFLQKYYKNSHWAKQGGPNFLLIGGESPESYRWVTNENITYLTWARKFGAMVYSLEHRYYGDSIVGGNSSDPNPDLKYLSSIQMLYDVASFIRGIKQRTRNTAPWIVFGGSYSGNLALWMRQLFPDLVLGAVGSSAPIEAKLDFYEYLEVVENAIRTYNYSCAEKIAEGFAEMHELALSGAGRKRLSTVFTLVPKWTEATNVTDIDLQFFFSNIYGPFQGAVQYNAANTGAYANGYGIREMCSFMNDESHTALENIARFNEYMTAFYSGGKFNCTENSYKDFIEHLKQAQQFGPKAAASWLWTWQTCTEFGYFQSSDSGYSIFGSPTPVNLFTRMCTDLYGEQYTTIAVQRNIDKINNIYGGIDFYKGTNVVIPNGSIDPWHALGKYTSNDPSVVTRLIKGTAHCADMYPAREQDPPGLIAARKLTEDNIAKWLKSAEAITTATPRIQTTLESSPADSTLSTTTAISGASASFMGYAIVLQFFVAMMIVF